MNPALYRFLVTLGNLYLCGKSAKSPTPPASAEERKKYEADKATSDVLSSVIWWYIPVGLVMLYIPPLIEQYVILRSINSTFDIPPLDSFLSKYVASHPAIAGESLPIGITRTFILGAVMVFTGSLIRIICFRHLGKQFTFELSSRNDDRLITDGLYSIVRHPSYTGSLLMINGMLLCELSAGSWWAEYGLWETMHGKVFATVLIAFCENFVFSLVRRVPKEDKLLKKQFGRQWDEWAKRTPYRLVPGVY